MGLVEAQDEIRDRLRHGATLAEVKREIIDPAPCDEDQKAALWLYANLQPEVIDTAGPLHFPRGWEIKDA